MLFDNDSPENNQRSFNYDVAGVFGWDDGDYNDDDLVNGLDWTILLPNFGVAPFVPPLSASSVPEPSSALLAAIFFGTFVQRRRRKS